MRGWVVFGSPDVLSCRTGWQALQVSPLPDSQALDDRRSPQVCSSAVLLGTVLMQIPLAVCPRLLLQYDPGRVISHGVCRGSEQASMPTNGPKAEWTTAKQDLFFL